MTDLVQNLKIGNSTYAIQDGNTLPALTASQRTTLLSNGTYLGKAVANGVKFENDSGKFESFTDTITGSSLTWSSGTLPNQTYWSSTSAYGDGTFVFVTNGGSYGAAYSTNGGKNWTAATIPSGITGSWIQTAYGNGVFVAIPENSTNALYSTDGGRTWQASTMPASDYKGLAFGGGRFIATPRNRNTGAYSDDGIHWYSLNMSSWQYWYNIAYGNNRFVAVSYLNNKAAYSADGSSWTEVSLPSASTWDTMAFGNGRFVAICSGDRKCTYSTDGDTWSDAIDLDVEVRWIQFGNGIFIGTGSDGNSIYTSSDGVTWTKSSTLSGTSWSITGAGGGYFVAIRYSYGRTNVVSSGAYVINHEYSLTPLSYTKSEVDTALSSKQGTLTAGTNITIDSNNIISATGGGGSVSYKGVNTQSMAGTTDPTSSTEASVGTLYVNTTTSTPFICVNNVMTPNYTLNTVSTGYATVTDGILTASSGWATVSIPQIPSNSTISYVTKVKIKSSAASLTSGRNLLNLGESSGLNSFGLYLLSSGVFALSSQVNGSWSQHNSTVSPIVGSYMWLAFSIDSNGSVTSSVSLDGESWQQLCSPFTFSSASGYTTYVVGDMGNIESGWETDTDLTKTHLYINGVEEKLYNISNVSWSELHDSSVVQTLPVSPTTGKIYFVTGSTT